MTPIKKYVDQIVSRHREQVGGEPDQLLMGERTVVVDWNEELRSAGYYSTEFSINTLGSIDKVLSVMEWLRANVEEQNFIWTGHQLWFNREQDMTLFILTWK